MMNYIFELIPENHRTDLRLHQHSPLIKSFSQAQILFYKNKFMKIMNLMFEQRIGFKCKSFDSKLALIIDDLKEKCNLNKNNSKSSELCFFTISPPPNKSINDFINAMHKLSKKLIFKDSIYVFEQRNSAEVPGNSGIHCHLLALRNKKYSVSKCRDRFLDALISKNVFNEKNKKNLRNKDYCSLQVCSKEKLDDKLKYILGFKDDYKLSKSNYDKIFRKKHSIKDYYLKIGNYFEEIKILDIIHKIKIENAIQKKIEKTNETDIG